jgi:hypothetical protein
MVDILSFATSSNNTAVGRTSAMKTARLQLSRKKGFNLQNASNALKRPGMRQRGSSVTLGKSLLSPDVWA